MKVAGDPEGRGLIYALTEQTARCAEERAVDELGLTLADLMRRAGAAVAREVGLRIPFGAVAIVVGKGNNGGDGWVTARELHMHDRPVRVFTSVAPDDIDGIAGEAAQHALAAGVAYSVIDESMLTAEVLSEYAAIVDAIFGMGFSGSVRAPYDAWIDAINASGANVFAVDVPSGVETDTGEVAGHAISANVTITFSAPKVGIVNYPGAEMAGEVVVEEIGIPHRMLGESGDPEIWTSEEYAGLLPPLPPDVHKNMCGRVLIVAGSGAYPGAAALAVMGAQRMGAGYVTVAVPESVQPILQSKLTSAVVMGLPENPSHTFASKVTEEVLDVAREFDAVVLGPGLTVSRGAVLVVRNLVSALSTPIVLDADGLNAMVDAVDVLTDRDAPTVITPHPGELARLLDTTPASVQSDRLGHGARLTGERLACVLKGARSVVSGRGRQVVTLVGGPALATAGTGDVLAGMAGTLLAQGAEPFEAGALAAYVHGRAGDHAADELSERCVMAEDVPGYIPSAVRELLGSL